MIRGFKRYPETEDSGLGWIGQVPTHWSVTALHNRYQQCLGKMLDTKRITGEHLVPYLRNTDVQWDHVNVSGLPVMDIHPKEFERYTLRRGDLVVCEGGEVGRCSIWQGELDVCGFQKALHRLRPHQTERDLPRFLLYALRLAAEKGAFDDGHTSTIEHLTGEKLRAYRFAFPPAPEQGAIARFLDHADHRIQRYIHAKQKLVALLEEQTQVIIQQAVAGQLDVQTGQPYRTYRRGAVERVERLPAHWEVRRFRSLVKRIDQGVSPQAENRRADDTSWGVLKAGCVNGGVFKETEHKRLPHGFPVDRALAVREGDVLVSRASGSPRFVGSVGRISTLSHKLILSDKTFRPIFGDGIVPDFMVLAMNCRFYREQVEQAISGAEGLANNLPLSALKSFRFAVPPPDEQQRIVHYLRSCVDQLAAAIAMTEREIGLLNELRATLVANVVSGKVDVREAAIGFADEKIRKYEDSKRSGESAGLRRRVNESEPTNLSN